MSVKTDGLKKLKKELQLIKNKNLRKWTIQSLLNAPEEFWTIPASKSNKYHPPCANVVGGLVNHVKRAVFFGNLLATSSGANYDVVISALLLHDIGKTSHGDNFRWHDIDALKYFKIIYGNDLILKSQIPLIKEAVKHHMGQWTLHNEKKPLHEYTLIEEIVHSSDYLASRKEIVTPIDYEVKL